MTTQCGSVSRFNIESYPGHFLSGGDACNFDHVIMAQPVAWIEMKYAT